MKQDEKYYANVLFAACREERTMQDRWEESIFHMAEQEQMVMPQSMTDRIEEILCKPKEKRFRMNFKKSIILAAAMIMLISATAVASVGALRERMEAMNREKMEEYFTQIYASKIGVDNYNRPYTDTEKERMSQLREAYEDEARFPKGELTMIEEAEKYKGKGVALLGDTTTFFFPEGEMSDEELLQIIDFMHKRDYSLQKMNEMIAAGEAQLPEIEEEEIEATDISILEGDAVYEPTQELTIPYTGDLELDLTIAAGRNELFLAGYNTVHRMEIGSSDSEFFFDDFGVETRILAMCQDVNGDVYMALWQWPDENDWESRELAVWVVNKDGELLRKIDMSPYMARERIGYARRMTIGADGYLYLSVAGLKSPKEAQECEILVLDREGNYISRIAPDEYALNLNGGLGVGKDGKVYTCIENYYDSENPERRMGIASLNAKEGTLDEIYYDIMPENTIMIDIIAPGAESDFVFWGYNGIFTYNMGDEKAVNVLPVYEAPCDWEGTRYCALYDGRIVIAAASDYRIEEHPLGKRFLAVPEKTCFYYMPGI
ncbi:MAG: hypothetical protein HDR18_02285 [Lachnospiraceae bacterium]|nr:hypothetical protein [Lachnospiraceae bacterium]